MKYLYAPWRSLYNQQVNSKTHPNTCPFCHHHSTPPNETSFIIAQFTHSFVMLNLFPYNPGHLMVIPYRHKATLTALTSEERAEIMEITTLCTTILKRACKTKGFNIGINLGGKAAGGSIPRHLHMHIVPRWIGDTGFLTTLAETKALSANLPELCQRLKNEFARYLKKHEKPNHK